jgi:hypothetical protein
MASTRSSRRSAKSRRSAQQSSYGRRTRRTRSSTSYPAVTQGVGSAAPLPFGSRRGSSLDGLNALSPYHLSLPRPVGPYTVVRTSTVTQSSQGANIFCPETLTKDNKTTWTHVIGRLNGDLTSTIGTDTSYVVNRGGEFFGPSVTLVPAAFSVQIMNPNALQTTSGVIYIGRSTSQYKLANDPRTWQELMDQFVSFMSPRLCSAGKLALRGVKVDSYPLNMTEFSDFCPQAPITGSVGNTNTVWNDDGTSANTSGEPSAFAPIVVYNPSGVNLQYLVTVEWRVRFDPSSAAAASHQYHRSTPMSTWDSVISSASRLGHGARDITETISRIGEMMPLAHRVYRAMAPEPAEVPIPAFGL